MTIRQYYLACLSHASYLITDDKTKTAAVVDPQRDVDQYLKDAAAGGHAIKHVFLTHFHADFISGLIELRDRAGATIRLGRKAQAEFDCVPMKDGDTIEFGDTRLEVMETPGHTPEGIPILVYDLAQSTTDPSAALTGDTLFIGDVGRPDLLASVGVTADQPEAPDYFVHDAILNRKERPALHDALEKQLQPLSVEDVLAVEKTGGSCSTSATESTSRGATSAGRSTSPCRGNTPPGRARCSPTTGRSW